MLCLASFAFLVSTLKNLNTLRLGKKYLSYNVSITFMLTRILYFDTILHVKPSYS